MCARQEGVLPRRNSLQVSLHFKYSIVETRQLIRNSVKLRDVLKGLSHEIDFKNVDSNLQNLA
jgi:hypothetical protein